MITLILDTSHRALAVGVAVDGTLIASHNEVLLKKHSETLITVIDRILADANVSKKEINQIVVTDGPGSYTGMRIGLTFVKVFALTQDVAVYTVDTLLSLSGLRDGFSFIDARSKRVFGAFVSNGSVSDERVYSIDEVDAFDSPLYGDLELLGGETNYGNIAQNMLDVEASWIRVENVDVLVPRYVS